VRVESEGEVDEFLTSVLTQTLVSVIPGPERSEGTRNP
jgi:hypothetical protein